MERKGYLASLFIIIVLANSNFITINSTTVEDNFDGDINKVVNNELILEWFEFPNLDLINIITNSTSNQIILQFLEIPIIDHQHGYRVIIDWSKQLSPWELGFWPKTNWENLIPPKSNFTICVGGGVSELEIVNGSYTKLFNNETGEELFSELNNNNIFLENHSLIFSVNQSLITDDSLQVYFNESWKLPRTKVAVFVNYNTTETITLSNGTEILADVIWMELFPDNWINYLFNTGSFLTSSTFGIGIELIAIIVGIFELTYVIWRKENEKEKHGYG